MLTVTQLARRYQLSRTTVLYYEREGLLAPRYRSDNGYRWYGDDEAMKIWHRQFEKMEPDAHQEFLESLHIDKGEIDEIRAWSRG